MEEDKGMYAKHLMPTTGTLLLAAMVPLFILLTAAWVLYLGGRVY